MKLVVSSKNVSPNDTFICLPNGESYISEALSNGAKQVLRLSRIESGRYACQYYNNPSKSLSVIGVTGTNGKSTVTWLVHHAIIQLGGHSALQGTLTSPLTTPESPETCHNMATHYQQGGTHFVMEVSSHAIHQHRIEGISFTVKCLTNITHDHLDYHGSLDAYRTVKKSFVTDPSCICIGPGDFEKDMIPSSTALKGSFNLENLQATKRILLSLGYSEPDIDRVISTLSAPPGRFELLHEHPMVIVDYAHTPDALHRVLVESRQLIAATGKLYVVVGCGGNRDQQKRPIMGQMSTNYADYAIFTQDNPRLEDSQTIINDMLNGVDQDNIPNVHTILNRKKAISFAVQQLRPNDGLVIAGKGHESVQYVGKDVIPFDDRQIATECIKAYLT